MKDQRKERRDSTVWPGRIAFDRGAQLRECVIRDISESGARLTIQNPRAIPSAFELLIVATGEIFQAVAKWRRDREIGVHFVRKDEFLAWPTRPRPGSTASAP
jgi:hypothetical protein